MFMHLLKRNEVTTRNGNSYFKINAVIKNVTRVNTISAATVAKHFRMFHLLLPHLPNFIPTLTSTYHATEFQLTATGIPD